MSYQDQTEDSLAHVESKARADEPLPDNSINLTLLDPARWGWTAGGGIADLLTPHERARRKSTKKSILQSRLGKKRPRRESFSPTFTDGSGFVNTFEKLENECPDKDVIAESTCDSARIDLNRNIDTVGSPCDAVPIKNRDPKLHDNKIHSTGGKNRTGEYKFRSYHENGNKFFIQAYHRGREGHELRDHHTGDLLCNTNIKTDSNFGVDTEPKTSVVTITINFPLDDTPDTSLSEQHSRRSDINNTAGVQRYYTETIRWNLLSTKTPTPLSYAASVGSEFGLSYSQTLDLADSIQQQIQSFVNDSYTNVPPVALRGILSSLPSPHLVDLRQTPVIPMLYGEDTFIASNASRPSKPIKQKSRDKKLARSASSLSSTSKIISLKGSEKFRDKNNSVTSTKVRETGNSTTKRKKATSFIESEISESVCKVEIQSRLLASSIDDISNRDSTDVVFYQNYWCHLCKEEKPLCGVFACTTLRHAYCTKHLAEKLNVAINLQEIQPLRLQHCPICSLACDCTECCSRLSHAAIDFKNECIKQHATAETTLFPNIFEHCKLINKDTGLLGSLKSRNGKGIKRKKDSIGDLSSNVTPVQKIPQNDFPREVADGIDLDHGFNFDYKVIYTDKGSFIANQYSCNAPMDSQLDSIAKNPENDTMSEIVTVLEDGNVDYCNICLKVGNLLCCDFCPRAFHIDCLSVDQRSSNIDEADKWECYHCKRENNVLPEDVLNGKSSQDTFTSASVDFAMDEKAIKVLSVLLEMVQTLMSYDFGYMFRNPVDPKQVPSYSTIVKKPMDLGTIASKIISGMYGNNINNSENPLDDLVVGILSDVDLVWHNCFIFNSESSAVYRMAEVQRKRASAITKASLVEFLSDKARNRVLEYQKACEVERSNSRSDVQTDGNDQNAKTNPKIKAKHKIIGTPPQRGGKGRPVAVLDPDTGRIVKIYTTMQSACNCVNFFFERNLKSEMPKESISPLNRLRAFVSQGKNIPAQRLFGYRWVLLEDLRCGNVVFSKDRKLAKKLKSKEVIDEVQCAAPKKSKNGHDSKEVSKVQNFFEILDGDRSYVLKSVDECLSYPAFHDGLSVTKDQLNSMPPGIDVTDGFGRKWMQLEASADQTIEEVLMKGDEECFIKEDLLSGVILTGFRTIDSMFQDWLSTLDASLRKIDNRSFENFQSFYLDQENTIDGISWRTVKNEPRSTEPTFETQGITLPETNKQSANKMLSFPSNDTDPSNICKSNQNDLNPFAESNIERPLNGTSYVSDIQNGYRRENVVESK